ncbi:MAG TPA: tonB-system energizer ExbB [Gammaproteobacteria bacterium]|nr:tonB-system energizer ExbB [Gammaproteobacteria bacterium]
MTTVETTSPRRVSAVLNTGLFAAWLCLCVIVIAISVAEAQETSAAPAEPAPPDASVVADTAEEALESVASPAIEEASEVLEQGANQPIPGEASTDVTDAETLEPVAGAADDAISAEASDGAIGVDEAEAEGGHSATLPQNLSPWGMFMSADWVVKSVMVGLIVASLLTWTALLAKSIELSGQRRLLRRSLDKIAAAHTLAEAANAKRVEGVARALIQASERELKLSAELLKHDGDHDAMKAGVKERTVSSLSRIEASCGRRLLVGTGLLATIGAVAPFVGLFGTVWGIMNAFIGISHANTTNLAVVAPGIAEALLATALGLVAAIPAVMIYNHFTRKIMGIKALVADCSAAIMRLVSRDLDRGTSLRLVQAPQAKAE